LRGADSLRQRIALRLQILRSRLDSLALGLERFEARDIERDAAPRERRADALQIISQRMDVEHARDSSKGHRVARALTPASNAARAFRRWPSRIGIRGDRAPLAAGGAAAPVHEAATTRHASQFPNVVCAIPDSQR